MASLAAVLTGAGLAGAAWTGAVLTGGLAFAAAASAVLTGAGLAPAAFAGAGLAGGSGMMSNFGGTSSLLAATRDGRAFTGPASGSNGTACITTVLAGIRCGCWATGLGMTGR